MAFEALLLPVSGGGSLLAVNRDGSCGPTCRFPLSAEIVLYQVSGSVLFEKIASGVQKNVAKKKRQMFKSP